MHKNGDAFAGFDPGSVRCIFTARMSNVKGDPLNIKSIKIHVMPDLIRHLKIHKENKITNIKKIYRHAELDSASQVLYNKIMGRETDEYYIYILTNRSNKTLYIGITNDLIRRVYEHRNHVIPGFTDKYNITKLVYYETYSCVTEAIYREKQLKNWTREWKRALINRENPEWNDLWNEISDAGSGPA